MSNDVSPPPEKPPASPPPSPSGSPAAPGSPDPADRLQAILARFQLDPEHPPACLAEAAAHLAAPGFDDPALTDLEALPFVTIDNEDSKDLDQALYIETAGDGHVVWYALADASHYVRPGSALFAESLRRGASYYLPDLVVPMLPRSLSEGLVSLNPDVPRRALTFRVALDGRGDVTSVALVRARIRSHAKLSYHGVQRFWDGDPTLDGQPFSDSLRALALVGRRRAALAEARHVVRYPRVEVGIGLTPRGFVAFEERREATDRANEQISLLINVEGARLLADTAAPPSLQGVFRVHPAPMAADFDHLARTTAALAEAHREPRLVWRPDVEPLAAYLDRIGALVADLPGPVAALQRQALLVNQQSTFSAEPGLHYGVGAPCYARFTSPMREVVGIFTHKEALELLGLVAPGPDDDHTRDEVIAAANRAKDLQHQLTKASNQLVIADLLGADLALAPDARPRRPGTVVGLAPDKAYVVLDDPPLELKVYARDLGGRARLVDDDTALAVERPDGRLVIRLGARLELVAADYDATRDRFVLRPV